SDTGIGIAPEDQEKALRIRTESDLHKAFAFDCRSPRERVMIFGGPYLGGSGSDCNSCAVERTPNHLHVSRGPSTRGSRPQRLTRSASSRRIWASRIGSSVAQSSRIRLGASVKGSCFNSR